MSDAIALPNNRQLKTLGYPLKSGEKQARVRNTWFDRYSGRVATDSIVLPSAADANIRSGLHFGLQFQRNLASSFSIARGLRPAARGRDNAPVPIDLHALAGRPYRFDGAGDVGLARFLGRARHLSIAST
jgi:hypothetical protein